MTALWAMSVAVLSVAASAEAASMSVGKYQVAGGGANDFESAIANQQMSNHYAFNGQRSLQSEHTSTANHTTAT